jgi:hypothetical protein
MRIGAPETSGLVTICCILTQPESFGIKPKFIFSGQMKLLRKLMLHSLTDTKNFGHVFEPQPQPG